MKQEELNQILEKHKKWVYSNYKEGRRADLSGADLFRATLSEATLSEATLFRANLFEANLSEANLYRANLSRANLSGANLSGVDLSGADLFRANLSEADLYRANLSGANLFEANLSGANLYRATLPFGETFEQYNEIFVPQLCTITGKSLEEVAKHWDCHDWTNCPMAFVFNVKSENNIPLVYKPRVREFIQYFDAKLLPKPVV